MQEFCPLCDKRGYRRRIKALQINFHEAIWACEGEEVYCLFFCHVKKRLISFENLF